MSNELSDADRRRRVETDLRHALAATAERHGLAIEDVISLLLKVVQCEVRCLFQQPQHDEGPAA